MVCILSKPNTAHYARWSISTGATADPEATSEVVGLGAVICIHVILVGNAA